jgi:diaminohydroxyphosphoribosylaminopyrimidine deaminase/5-amino-6-(5-phosphoribosylamino)uracil reductase
VESRLVGSAKELPVVLVCGRGASRTNVQALEAAGVEVIVAAGANEAARVSSALDELGSRDIQSLLLEGGPHLTGAFLEAGEIDELRVFVAPLVAGGREARTAIEGLGTGPIAGAARALSTEMERIDDDMLITARLREW